jgi:hypothetical protein
MAKKKASKAFLEAGKKWRAHLDAFRASHPKLSLGECMKGAKKTYKK